MSPEAERAAIELLGWLELHLDDAPALVITGVNEPFLPQSVSGDAFLPDSLRTRLGLPDNHGRYARDAYLLSAILSSRPGTVLIAGRRSSIGDPLRPSRLLFASGGRVVAERVLRFFGGEATARPPAAWTACGDSARFRMPVEKEIVPERPIGRLRVTDFKMLLEDPYRFALERVLDLKAVEDGAAELDPLGFGSLTHDVLAEFGNSVEANGTDARAMRARLDASLDAEVTRRFGGWAAPAVAVQVELLRIRLHDFADWQASWVTQGWRVEAVETEPPDPGFTVLVDGEPFVLRGRVDRVDHNPRTGEWAVFDYKTSENGEGPEKTHRSKPREPERYGGRVDADGTMWVDLQLPLYRLMLPKLVRPDGTPVFRPEGATGIKLGYIVLPSRVGGEHALFGEWTSAQLAKAEEDMAEVIRHVRGNRFVFDPGRVVPAHAGDLAVLLGVGQLVALDADDEEGGEE